MRVTTIDFLSVCGIRHSAIVGMALSKPSNFIRWVVGIFSIDPRVLIRITMAFSMLSILMVKYSLAKGTLFVVTAVV